MTLKTPLIGIGGTLVGFLFGSIPGAIAGGAIATGGSWGVNKLGEKVAGNVINRVEGETGIEKLNQD